MKRKLLGLCAMLALSASADSAKVAADCVFVSTDAAKWQRGRAVESQGKATVSVDTSKAAQTMMHQRSVASLIFHEAAVLLVDRQLAMEVQ